MYVNCKLANKGLVLHETATDSFNRERERETERERERESKLHSYILFPYVQVYGGLGTSGTRTHARTHTHTKARVHNRRTGAKIHKMTEPSNLMTGSNLELEKNKNNIEHRSREMYSLIRRKTRKQSYTSSFRQIVFFGCKKTDNKQIEGQINRP